MRAAGLDCLAARLTCPETTKWFNAIRPGSFSEGVSHAPQF